MDFAGVVCVYIRCSIGGDKMKNCLCAEPMLQVYCEKCMKPYFPVGSPMAVPTEPKMKKEDNMICSCKNRTGIDEHGQCIDCTKVVQMDTSERKMYHVDISIEPYPENGVRAMGNIFTFEQAELVAEYLRKQRQMMQLTKGIPQHIKLPTDGDVEID